MIVALALAAAMSDASSPAPQPPRVAAGSLATWEEIDQEFKATGKVTCPVSAEERRLAEVTRSRAIRQPPTKLGWPEAYEFSPNDRPPACAIVALTVNRYGRASNIEVLRYKGPGNGVQAANAVRVSKWPPASRPWNGLFIFETTPSSTADAESGYLNSGSPAR